MRRKQSRDQSALRRAGGKRGQPPREPLAPAPPLSLRHPAMLAAILIAAACALFSVTFRIIDTDFWQHLAVGRAIWSTHAIPHTQVWSWPTYGTPDVLPSWLFRTLLWPFYQAGGLNGLFVWRWLTTLLAFGLVYAAARRMGARGFMPLVILAIAALVYRQRSQVRPETMAAVLLAMTLFLLESRRAALAAGGSSPRITWMLVGVALVWVNAHISYVLLFILLGIHLLDGHVRAARGRGPAPRDLWWIALACAAVSFINPFGWHALWQPFDFFLHWRDSTMFQGIGELRAVGWGGNETNGVFLLLAGWPLLQLWRARRGSFDLAEAITCLFITAYALPSQRFLSTYALVAALYVCRDLDAWVQTRLWPRWATAPAVRAALAIAACVGLSLPEWFRRDSPMRPGIGMDLTRYPVAACDFIAAHDIRGRAFNQSRLAGYMLWRFWPDRGRLPFFSIHPESSPPEIRTLYAAIFTDASAWTGADAQYRFDYVLLDRHQYGSDRLYDRLDADSNWALAFADDAALLYLRRDGALAAKAERLGYRVVPGGREALVALRQVWVENDSVRAAARADLMRQTSESPFCSGANSMLGDIAMVEGRFDEARALLERSLAIDPAVPHAHERLGMVAMFEQDMPRAIRAFEQERRVAGTSAALEVELAFARETAGDREGARRGYLEALRLEPGNPMARERLAEIGGGPSRP